MTGILGQLKWKSLKKGEKTIDLYCYIKVLMVKPVYQQMTLSPKLGVVETSTLWHFRLPLPIQIFIKVTSSPRLSGIGMPSPILWSHPLKMLRIVLLRSLLRWELGTNSLITGPGEWLSFRRFTSKLSWSWSWGGVINIIIMTRRRPGKPATRRPSITFQIYKFEFWHFLALVQLRIKIWFFDIHRMMKPVGGAKIPWSAKRFL